MKIALVHDLLAEFGGAERFLQNLIEIFPDADVYTSFTEPQIITEHFPSLSKSKLHVTWVQGSPLMSRSSLFQCLSPFVWNSLNLEEYDLVISSSSHLMSSLVPVHKPIHIQYIHNPPKNIFGILPKTHLQHIIPYTKLVQSYYIKSLKRSSLILTNSLHIQNIIKNISSLNSIVIYPPISIPKYIPLRTPKYYLCFSRIDRTKDLELAIKACTKLKLPLQVVGKTNDENYLQYLKAIAGPTVSFSGPVLDSQISNLFKNAIALIFPSKNEDFGLVPVEAMSYGVPVIAYNNGGLKETVINKKTGLFFYEHTAQSLENTLRNFSYATFSQKVIITHSRKFSKEIFRLNLFNVLSKYLAT